jgi:phage tail sheath protein FI
MPLNPVTPGVYIQEISTLPSSVVAVATAIPVFIGFTEKVVVDGAPVTSFPTDPIRIESMLEFQTIFGGANPETFSATLTGATVNVAITQTTTAAPFRLFYDMQMYFGNGGGPCWIISAGDYSTLLADWKTKLLNGIDQAEKADEITLVVIPEVTLLSADSDRLEINDAMLIHCAKLQDRFAVLDVLNNSPTINDDADEFRNLNVGPNNLSYGAAYYPSFTSSLSFSYSNSDVKIVAIDPDLPASVLAFDTLSLDSVLTGTIASGDITITGAVTDGTALTINLIALTTAIIPDAAALSIAINTTPLLNQIVLATYPGIGDIVTVTAKSSGTIGNYALAYGGLGPIALGATLIGGKDANQPLANQIKTLVNSFALELYPSAMMAGIYANVDANLGVWKAPANVGVTLVKSLNRIINDEAQGPLNVDATSGKSINALRNFIGRGNLVWGARTLDGNSNEWRYINVRRLFIMAEESCKKACEFVVFEPNDKNTWIRVKGMIGNFLTGLWRDGALAGDKPDQAFFVKVGLGETMTAQDILEGRMIVQIGLAAVRPAEFIILQFEHKLQEA